MDNEESPLLPRDGRNQILFASYHSGSKQQDDCGDNDSPDGTRYQMTGAADDPNGSETMLCRGHACCHNDPASSRKCWCGLEVSNGSKVYDNFCQTISGETRIVELEYRIHRRIRIMLAMAVVGLVTVLFLATWIVKSAKPPKLPVGPYQLRDKIEGNDLFQAFTFFKGDDSAGSRGYNSYVDRDTAWDLDIAKVKWEKTGVSRRHRIEPFVYLSSAPTKEGPRQSIRLESIQRYDRGLFIIDIRHMPTGCGVWPAFWLTDEAHWPNNGEIDIIEAVNYQSDAKTALHSVEGCTMENAPLGTMTGIWDEAQYVPDIWTGLPDATKRPARDCFVYARHQWLNQGCAVTNSDGGTIGGPLNDKGGGVFVLEWDPIYQHVRSWVFTPRESMPENLALALRTAHLPIRQQVAPNPGLWPLSYSFFPIGPGTGCPASPFQHMRMVINTAFCGSAAGGRFQIDCPEQSKTYESCEEWIQSNPSELLEVYWKIRGVYVYERAWVHAAL